MLIDSNLRFANATALSTAGAGTTKLGSALNLKTANLDWGEGEPMWLVGRVLAAVTSGGAATVAFALTGADNDALTTNPENYFLSDTFALASLTAAAHLFTVALPKNRLYKQYLGLRQIIATAALTAGSVNIWLTRDPDTWRAYNQGRP